MGALEEGSVEKALEEGSVEESLEELVEKSLEEESIEESLEELVEKSLEEPVEKSVKKSVEESVEKETVLDKTIKKLNLVHCQDAIKEIASSVEDLPYIAVDDLCSDDLKSGKLDLATARLVISKIQSLKGNTCPTKPQSLKKKKLK